MRVFTICLFLIFSHGLYAQSLTDRGAEDFTMQSLEEYSPSSHRIMNLLASLPNEYAIGYNSISLSEKQSFLGWIGEKTKSGVIESLNTVVHESMHSLTSRYAYELLKDSMPEDYGFRDRYSAFYLSEEEVYLVKHSKVFTSNKLKQVIPKKLRTFRYDPYIVPRDNNLGSQAEGVYGLMDEWNAYYHGTRTAYELFEYYKSKAEDKNQGIYLEHVSNLAGTYFAYYEFKYYILKYMEMAKAEQPEVYEGLMSNEVMRRAYTAIDDKFSQLLSLFEERLDTIETIVTSDDYTSVHRQDGYYFIGSSGVGLFSDEAERLKVELEKAEMVKLDQDLRIN